MKQEIWEYIDIINDCIVVSEKKNLNILDIGCGAGDAFFFLYHEFNNINYTGIDKKNREDYIEISKCHFNHYNSDKLLNEIKKRDNDINSFQFDLYDYYKFIAKEIIKTEKRLSAKQFKKKFIDNVKWGKNIEDFFEDQCLQKRFDIIILSKVIHYFEDRELNMLIDNCWKSLENNRPIFIKNPIKSGRIDYSSNDIREMMHKFNELILLEDEKVIIYIGCKSDQQTRKDIKTIF